MLEMTKPFPAANASEPNAEPQHVPFADAGVRGPTLSKACHAACTSVYNEMLVSRHVQEAFDKGCVSHKDLMKSLDASSSTCSKHKFLCRPDIKALMPHDVPPEEVLGSGASGEVHASTYEGQAVAVKRFVSDVSPDGHARDEIAVTCCINHPNLIKVIGMIAEPPSLVVGRVLGQQMAAKPNLQVLVPSRNAFSKLFPVHSLAFCQGNLLVPPKHSLSMLFLVHSFAFLQQKFAVAFQEPFVYAVLCFLHSVMEN